MHAMGGNFIGMHLFWWLFWIVALGTLFTMFTPVPKQLARSGPRALDILRRRYAAGQVSTEEYEARKSILERDEPGPVSSGHAH